MVIRPGDRISTVLAHGERMVDVLVSLSPVFERLRSPTMRKVMARLATVEQAAKLAGLDPQEVVAALNRAIGADARPVAERGADDRHAPRPGLIASRGATPATGMPPWLRQLPPERIVDLDVREDLRSGREPFSRIMAARRAVPEGGVLRLRVIFEPVPLYAVMARHGFEHWTERLADDDWRVWFYRHGSTPAATDPGPADLSPALAGPAEAGHGGSIGHESRPGTAARETDPARPGEAGGDDVAYLDVRGLEPPEPMLRTLEAAERLPPGGTLVQINVRVPQFLLPQLEERGFTYEVREQEPGLVRVFIRRRADA